MTDDRGLANVLIIFALGFVLLAFLYLFLNPLFTNIDVAADCSTQACTDGVGWVNDMWTFFPLTITALLGIYLIRGAITESRRGGV